ncbi:MAG: Spy/CpxP family protein refolding chaperone [Rhodospirillales bacterium]
MNSRTKISLAVLAIAVGLGGGAAFMSPSLAQVAGGPAVGEHKDHPGFHRARSGSFGRIDGRLAFLKAELKITSAQEPLWAAFEKTMRDNAGEMKTRVETMQAARKKAFEERKKAADEAKAAGKEPPAIVRPGAVERMERMQELAKVRMERQAKLLTAFKPLYAALGDEQKKIADELFARHGQGRHGHRAVRH